MRKWGGVRNFASQKFRLAPGGKPHWVSSSLRSIEREFCINSPRIEAIWVAAVRPLRSLTLNIFTAKFAKSGEQREGVATETFV